MIQKFLPNDTRTIELVSGASLLLFSILAYTLTVFTTVLTASTWIFTLVLFVIGLGQLLSIVYFESLEPVRCATAYCAGSIWLWYGITMLGVDILPTTILAIIMGLSNFYAFIIQALYIINHRKKYRI